MSEHEDPVRRLLREGELGQLIGIEEGLHFEAKGSKPYDLGQPTGRFELAKDVSALANSDGGMIVIGLTTTSAQTTQRDVVTGLDLVSVHDFDVAKYSGIIREHVWPDIPGLALSWHRHKDDATKGVGVIDIPPQSEDRKPFIISRVVDGGALLKQIVFGYARRADGDALPVSGKEIVAFMRQGMTPIPQRLTSIEEKLVSVLEQLAAGRLTSNERGSAKEAAETLERRITHFLDE